jgi:hypothetical protein
MDKTDLKLLAILEVSMVIFSFILTFLLESVIGDPEFLLKNSILNAGIFATLVLIVWAWEVFGNHWGGGVIE